MSHFKFVEDIGGLVVADAESALEIGRADLLLVDNDLERTDHDGRIGRFQIFVRSGLDDVGIRHAIDLVKAVRFVIAVEAGTAFGGSPFASAALYVFPLILFIVQRENAIIERLLTLSSNLIDDSLYFLIGDVCPLNSFGGSC